MRKQPDACESLYHAGSLAFSNGKSMDDCPLRPRTDSTLYQGRVDWLTGWLDARTNERLGHIFKKYGMTHP